MPIRVVVWGPGNVGAPAIRTILNHPELELAGVLVRSEEKEGVDAGTLVGVTPCGVAASRDVESVLSANVDALVYAVNQDFRPAEAEAEMLLALRRGITVVTAGTYGLLHPPTAEPALRERYEAACKEGGSRFLSSGIDPGFAMDLLPVVLSGVAEEIHELRIVENFNYATYAVTPEVLAIIGFGSAMDATPPMLLPGVPTGVWGPSLRALAEALDLEVDEIREEVHKHPLEREVRLEAGTLAHTLAKGSLGAFRFEVQAIVDGRPALVVEHITRIVDDTAPQWPSANGPGYHQVRLRGRPDIVLTLECEGEGGDHAAGGNATAAARIVSAIPVLLEAPPGLVSGVELPLLAGRGRVRPG